jgi:hypothetical protein
MEPGYRFVYFIKTVMDYQHRQDLPGRSFLSSLN